MSRQIIRQPNGLYAIWSTVVDNFTVIDATADELIDFLAVEEFRKSEIMTKNIIEALKNGEKPYRQFTMTWEQAQEKIKNKRKEVENDE